MILRTSVLVLFYLSAVIALALCLPVFLFFGWREALMAIGRGAMRASLWILGFDLDVCGGEWTSPKGPAVFMANHLSNIDGPLVFMLIGRPLGIIIKKSVFRLPIIGLAMRFVGFVPVDRKGVRTGRAAIDRAVGAIRKEGRSFLVFPEGTRSRSGELQSFRRGGFFLALESGTPVVPISVQGTYALLPPGQIVPRRGPIRVTFHPPVPAGGYNAETIGALAERVRNKIRAGLD